MKIFKFKGSKSIINRVLTISYFLKKPLILHNINMCEDVKTMIENLKKLGMKFELEDNSLHVSPPSETPVSADIFVQDAGTALRFFIVLIASLPYGNFSIDASEQLLKRPLQILIDALEDMNADIDFQSFPINIKSKGLRGGKIVLPSSISSQFVSALMLCSPQYEEDLEIVLSGNIVSRKYIILTQKIMNDFGIKINFENNIIHIAKGQKYKQLKEYFIEPDFSTASYFWALSALSNKRIYTWNYISNQPDKCFPEILRKIGADVKVDDNLISIKRNKLNGIIADMKDMPDQVPTLAVLALLLKGETIIKNIEHLKYKESNRIDALINEITKIGGRIKYDSGRLIIQPLSVEPSACIIESYDDHRIVMTFAFLSIIFPQISISSKTCVEKSYPEFFDDLSQISLMLDIKIPHFN